MTTTISVVIPTYNRKATVRRAIDSVLAQTRKPAEIIIVDDGSADGTAEMLAQAYGRSIRLIPQENGGASRARNTGITAATGALIAFLDSDDVWEPEKLAAQTGALEGSRAVLNYTNYRYLGREGSDTFADIGLALADERAVFERPLELLTRWHGGGQHLSGTLVGRQALLDVGLFDTRLRIAEDTKLFFSLARRGPFSLLRRPLWSRSEAIDPVTLTVQTDAAYQREHSAAVIPLLEELAAEAAGDPAIRRNVRRLLAFFFMREAKLQALAGRPEAARRLAARSLSRASLDKMGLRAALLTLAPTAAARLMSRGNGR
jgi:glycosyltransferase involved in cell wall biosynthesis